MSNIQQNIIIMNNNLLQLRKRIEDINKNYGNIIETHNNYILKNATEDELINLMKHILNDNENYAHIKWNQKNGYFYNEEIKLEYITNKFLIENIKFYDRLYNAYCNNSYDKNKLYLYPNSDILKIYLIQDLADIYNYFIFYTTKSVLSALKVNVNQILRNRSTALNRFNDLTNLKVILLGVYRNVNNNQIEQLKSMFNEKYILDNNLDRLIVNKNIKTVKKDILTTNDKIKNLVNMYKDKSNNQIIFENYNGIMITTDIPKISFPILNKFIEPNYGKKYSKIYLLYHKDFARYYFGSTTLSMEDRLGTHRKTIKCNQLYYAKKINEENINNFNCMIIEYVDTFDEKTLLERENYYIKKYESNYTLKKGGMNVLAAEKKNAKNFFISKIGHEFNKLDFIKLHKLKNKTN